MFMRELKDMAPRTVNDVFALLAAALVVNIAVVAGVIVESLHAAA